MRKKPDSKPDSKVVFASLKLLIFAAPDGYRRASRHGSSGKTC
jgi:hypothetical protein